MRRVASRQVRIRIRITEIINGHDADFGILAALVKRPQHVSADSAVSVDTHFDRHVSLPVIDLAARRPHSFSSGSEAREQPRRCALR